MSKQENGKNNQLKMSGEFSPELEIAGVYRAVTAGKEYLVRVTGEGKFLRITKAMDLKQFTELPDAPIVDVTDQAREEIENNQGAFMFLPINTTTIRKIALGEIKNYIEFSAEEKDDFILHGKQYGSTSLLMHIMEVKQIGSLDAQKIMKRIQCIIDDPNWVAGS